MSRVTGSESADMLDGRLENPPAERRFRGATAVAVAATCASVVVTVQPGAGVKACRRRCE